MGSNPINEDEPRELEYLHQLISCQFDISSTDTANEGDQPSAPPRTSAEPSSTVKPDSEDQGNKVAFKLFSGQNNLQIIDLGTKKLEKPDPENLPPQVFIPVERILDVADEPKHKRKLRRKQITSVAVDLAGIREMAKQITNKCERKLPSYRAINRSLLGPSPLAIVDHVKNSPPQMLPSTSTTTDGIKYPRRRTLPIPIKAAHVPSKVPSKTEIRKRRRERQKCRSANHAQDSATTPSRHVTLTYL